MILHQNLRGKCVLELKRIDISLEEVTAVGRHATARIGLTKYCFIPRIVFKKVLKYYYPLKQK